LGFAAFRERAERPQWVESRRSAEFVRWPRRRYRLLTGLTYVGDPPNAGLTMSKAAEYRSLATQFRNEAEEATLPNQRAMKISSAERWEVLADEAERTLGLVLSQPPKWVF
jgi:hypothetical protein